MPQPAATNPLAAFFGPAPLAIAHRGGSRLRPENTMAAFTHACDLGVDGLECDVHLAADGELVIIHDATLDRTTDAAGPVAGMTSAALAQVDAGYRFASGDGFPFRGRGIGVPRLRDLLAACPDRPIIVEIKGDDPRTAQRTVETVREEGAADRVVFAGFSRRVLTAVRGEGPALVSSASKDEVRSAVRRAMFRLPPRRPAYRVFQAPVRFGGRQVLSRALVRALRRAHIPTQAWVIDDERQMRTLVDWGVTGLISDRPDIALQVIRTIPGTVPA